MRERMFNVLMYGTETQVHSMSYCEFEKKEVAKTGNG